MKISENTTIQEQFFQACSTGDLKKIKTIYKTRQLHIDSKSVEGWTGLIMSCFYEHIRLVKFLISNGADVNATNKNGTSVFMYAKTPVLHNNRSWKILELLLEGGADINHLDCYNKTVLDYVFDNNGVALSRWLILKGAQFGYIILKKN